MKYHRSSSFFWVLSLFTLSILFQACQQPVPETVSPRTSQNETTQNETGQDETEDSTEESSQPNTSESSTPPPREAPREITYVAEKITPVSAQLSSKYADSKINVRSQPSTRSKAKHYGFKGDPVTLLKQAEGEGGYVWYYLRFDQSRAEGWVREDFVTRTRNQLLPRQSYRSYNFDTDPWLSSFNKDYQLAKQNKDSWLFNPTTVALRLAGYPNPDGCEPSEVSSVESKDSSITVLIKEGPTKGERCGDDSVLASEIRVDLVKPDQIWEIEWAGGRYRCRTGRGQQDFAPSLCS